MSEPATGAIILAAGASSRMRRNKLLLQLAGRTLLQHVVDAVANSALGEIIVVTGAEREALETGTRLPQRARFVHNPDFASGQASSLAAGLRALSPRSAAAAVLLGDQPGVSSDLIDRVLAAFRSSDALAARPVYLGGGRRVPGHPVILARELWPELVSLSGDTGARALLSRHRERVLEFDVSGHPPPDIDTEDDYHLLIQKNEAP